MVVSTASDISNCSVAVTDLVVPQPGKHTSIEVKTIAQIT
jgi:hypothetical protein